MSSVLYISRGELVWCVDGSQRVSVPTRQVDAGGKDEDQNGLNMMV
jgi:hypothetical protein